MSEPKTNCAKCGVEILQTTANDHQGLCVPCHWKAAVIPPDDFELPADLMQRIESLGEDPRRFRTYGWTDGIDQIHGFLDKIDESLELQSIWEPKLLEFERECREIAPEPDEASLTPRECAMLSILKTKIEQAERLNRRRNEVIICSLPLIAMPTARRFWPGSDERCVLLTPDEMSQWREIYVHPEAALWWFIDYWWEINPSPEPDEIFCREEDLIVPVGTVPWFVTSGLTWGELAGGVTMELWAWDGSQANFIRDQACIDF